MCTPTLQILKRPDSSAHCSTVHMHFGAAASVPRCELHAAITARVDHVFGAADAEWNAAETGGDAETRGPRVGGVTRLDSEAGHGALMASWALDRSRGGCERRDRCAGFRGARVVAILRVVLVVRGGAVGFLWVILVGLKLLGRICRPLGLVLLVLDLIGISTLVLLGVRLLGCWLSAILGRRLGHFWKRRLSDDGCVRRAHGLLTITYRESCDQWS